ncbi:hypothetical protein BDW74DRAFT_162457 [Aspergillus multicolor]|uniref:uncharacterized protein n=1 Tax=Aspergillus multicolor TaxID=41759 RepID=UPI003CCD0039
MGRGMESARGFYEILVPEYDAQPADSALSLAVSALASKTLSLWRGAANLQETEKIYTQAVGALRCSVATCSQRQGGKVATATLLAALALQLYENLASIFGLRSAATRVHHDGAVSLLPFTNRDPNDDPTNNKVAAYVRRYILHNEVSSALRQKRPLRPHAYDLIASQEKDLVAAPDNPSSTLDLIGTSVAELQASYISFLSDCRSVPPIQNVTTRMKCALQAEAQHLDAQLVSWAQSVPAHWTPLKVAGQDLDPSIVVNAFEETAEIYPSCQIGNVWNFWRCQRLILVKIILALNSLKEDQPDRLNAIIEYPADVVQCRHTLQGLVDSLCHSVPFYLGNRVNHSSMHDFTDPGIIFPTYPASPSPPSSLPVNPGRNDHKRHLIAQGHWHIMSPLSCLLTLLSDDEDDGHSLAGALRPGQCDWIRGQFLRVSTLLRLPTPSRPGGEGPTRSTSRVGGGMGQYRGLGLEKTPAPAPSPIWMSTGSNSEVDVNVKPEYLARRVRKAAVFLSGP